MIRKVVVALIVAALVVPAFQCGAYGAQSDEKPAYAQSSEKSAYAAQSDAEPAYGAVKDAKDITATAYKTPVALITPFSDKFAPLDIDDVENGDMAYRTPVALITPFNDEFAPMDIDDSENGDTADESTTNGGVSDDDNDNNDDNDNSGNDETPNDGSSDDSGIPGNDLSDGDTTNNDIPAIDAETQKENKPALVVPAGVTIKAAWSKCAIEIPRAVQAGVGFKIRLVGDRQDEKGKYDGETKFVPASWEIKGTPFGGYAYEKPFVSPYESVVSLKHAGTYTITAKYKPFTFMSDSGWVEDAIDFEYIQKATVSVPLTVVFHARGGVVSPSSKQYFLTEKCAFPLPSRKGYRFIGWYRASNGESADLVNRGDNVGMINTSKAASVTLYAQYSKSVKVRFNATKGKVKKKSKRVTYVTTYDKKKYGKLPKPTRKGYYFAGWYTKKKGGKYISAYSDVRTAKNITLYAHWVR
jgi:uncharacterized repeat protein (TIGR02543 family)